MEVDSRLGTWEDVRTLSEDVRVDGRSHRQPHFQQISSISGLLPARAQIHNSPECFSPTTACSRWEQARRISYAYIALAPRCHLRTVSLESGEKRLFWTTFTPQQIDIDVEHPQGRAYLAAILERFRSARVRVIRLDAVGYAIKKAGTSCFMIPETFRFIGLLAAQARALGMEVLVEVHSHYLQQLEIARKVDWVYDFALPPLVLHSLFTGDARPLAHWLTIRPHNSDHRARYPRRHRRH